MKKFLLWIAVLLSIGFITPTTLHAKTDVYKSSDSLAESNNAIVIYSHISLYDNKTGTDVFVETQNIESVITLSPKDRKISLALEGKTIVFPIIDLKQEEMTYMFLCTNLVNEADIIWGLTDNGYCWIYYISEKKRYVFHNK